MTVWLPSAECGAAHREVLRLIQAQSWREAAAASRVCIARYPLFAPGWSAASHIALLQHAPADALTAIERALALAPDHAGYGLQQARCLLALRRRRAALAATAAAQSHAASNAALWDAIGTMFHQLSDQHRALAAYDRAVALVPGAARFRYNRATVRRFVGDLDGAEADFDYAIAHAPGDAEAYYNRSVLRVQTAARNHVEELEARAALPTAPWQADVQIRYALAKEYEDLGEHAKAFAHLRLGAQRRRRHLQYDVSHDVATVDWIIEAFPGAAVAADVGAGAAHAAPAAAAPIFIVGLPRSGSTLVERILGSHSALTSAGELNCFALAITDAVAARTGRRLPRRELVRASAALDFVALGRDYLARAYDCIDGTGRFIDKMPLNYLYCGLIARALPDAKIIHVTRHPLAAGYAMYKTLFQDGYPFSYDLEDIGHYYTAYRRLMDHWRQTLPGVVYDLSYEALVADQAGETARLLAHCGLDWEDACLDFHRNPAASTTASAAQVRRPLYASSVAQWQHHAEALAPLRALVEPFC